MWHFCRTNLRLIIVTNEIARLEALKDLAALDTLPEIAFDDLVNFALERFKTPIAYISLVDETRQWFKAQVGFSICETPREQAFCSHTVQQQQVLVVEDASLDPRFQNSPLVTGPLYVRFYAGAPLIYKRQSIGAFCIMDTTPRSFTAADKDDLVILAKAAVAELEMSRARRFLLM